MSYNVVSTKTHHDVKDTLSKKHRLVAYHPLLKDLSRNEQLIRFHVKFCLLFLHLPQQVVVVKMDKTCL